MHNRIKLGIFAAFWLTVLAVVLTLSLRPSPANANPSAFARVQSNAATSTYRAISAGAGTTTLTYTSSLGNLAADSAVLNLRYTASTTAPVLALRIEHSYDGIDYYAETGTTTVSTTHSVQQITFATSTDAQFGSPGSGLGTAASSTIMREITITTPTRFTRAVIYGVSGSGSIYGELVAKQQNN